MVIGWCIDLSCIGIILINIIITLASVFQAVCMLKRHDWIFVVQHFVGWVPCAWVLGHSDGEKYTWQKPYPITSIKHWFLHYILDCVVATFHHTCNTNQVKLSIKVMTSKYSTFNFCHICILSFSGSKFKVQEILTIGLGVVALNHMVVTSR